jgi:heat-inducible transcriptional repressor
MEPTGTQLNERRQALLELIVGDYIRTATPVASQQLALRHHLKVSSATIRNDMAELENQGYISRPHTSAGGIPADRAYRFYVERIVPCTQPPSAVPAIAQQGFRKDEADLDGWARAAANILAQAVRNVAIATSPRVFQARMKQLQLVQVQEYQALLVLVMHETKLRQHLIRLPEPTNQEELDGVAKSLNISFSGKTAEEIKSLWPHWSGQTGQEQSPDSLPVQVVAEAIRLMVLEEQQESEQHYVEGLSQMLGQPEFTSGVRAREAVELLEDDSLVHNMLLEDPELGEVRVIIGEENRQRQFGPYSVVIARYGVPGDVVGTIGALGPTRMDYAGAIASVRYMADFLTTLLATLHGSSK